MSAAEHTESAGGDGYFEDPAPGFSEQETQEIEVIDVPEVDVQWEEAGIRSKLRVVGMGLHELIGRSEKDWLMTRQDLDNIAPPLTRILNRHEPLRAVAAASDPIDLLIGTGFYTGRSIMQAAAAAADAREAREADEERQATAQEARIVRSTPGSNGTEPNDDDESEDPEWTRRRHQRR